MTLSVTPQIAGDGAVMLSLSPIVSQQIAEANGKTPPLTSIRAADMLARVADGETIVVAGFTRDRETAKVRQPASRAAGSGAQRS